MLSRVIYIKLRNFRITPKYCDNFRVTPLSIMSGISSPRVLSIQSHVVYGYVGNKSATFPLQILGFEVDSINTVQFSNHTGYGSWKGHVLNDGELGDLASGLHENGLDNYTHLLTGYVGSPLFLTRIAQVVKQLRDVNPEMVYVCDPVMGDNGEMYVPKELLPIYRDTIIPLADILTPNQYEVELLTGCKVTSVADALSAMKHFHDQGVKTVVLTSTDLGSDDDLLGFASTVTGSETICLTVKIPRIPATFTGTGDLFAALFLAWMNNTNNDLKSSLQKSIATMQAVLKRTLAYAQETSLLDSKAAMELKLVQSKADIENPQHTESDILVEVL